MKLNLEAKTKSESIIKAYLEENASDVLAEKINNGVSVNKDGQKLISRKTLSGFIKFATDEAKKQAEKGASGACVEDSVVFGWAIHYFEEDSILGDLYNEDGTPYKQAKKTTTPAKPVEKPKPKPAEQQFSLFDILTETTSDDINEDAKEAEKTEEASAAEIESDEPATKPQEEKHWLNETTYVDENGEVHEIEPTPAKESDPLAGYDPEVLNILGELLGDVLDLG